MKLFFTKTIISIGLVFSLMPNVAHASEGLFTLPLEAFKAPQKDNDNILRAKPWVNYYFDHNTTYCKVTDIFGEVFANDMDDKCNKDNSVSNYNWPFGHAYDNHKGTDFYAKTGTNVSSASDGTVIEYFDKYGENWHPKDKNNRYAIYNKNSNNYLTAAGVTSSIPDLLTEVAWRENLGKNFSKYTNGDLDYWMYFDNTDGVDFQIRSSKEGYGNRIYFRTNDGYQLVYGHLQYHGIKVKTGTIQRGAILATSDNTGYSSGPHLHFEVRKKEGKNWVAIDPFSENLWITDGTPNVTTAEHILTAAEYEKQAPEKITALPPSQVPPPPFTPRPSLTIRIISWLGVVEVV